MKNQKAIVATWLLIVFFVVLFVGVGFFVWTYYGKSKTPSIASTTTPMLQSTGPAGLPSSYWKTYINDKYGYRINYIKTWSLNDSEPEKVYFNAPVDAPDSESHRYDQRLPYDNTNSSYLANDLTIYYYDTIQAAVFNTTNPPKTLIDVLRDLSYTNIAEVTLDGQKAYEALQKNASYYGKNGEYYTVAVQKNNHVYIIQSYRPSKDALTDIDKEIFSSFQFTN